ncbi:MAG: PadR family transcriptional regulator [Cyanobacteriota bacterium]|nr:PadR family transcriptional regulator [Cyanobacteriota bacterium]
MLELSALGLLQREPLHGYRLKQQLELFMGSCLSVNYGAIYPLLKRLEQRGYIEVMLEEAGEAGCCRRIYKITPSGRDRWRHKMLEQPQESWVKSRSRFLIKFFFFSDLEPSARQKLLELRLAVCYQRQDYLSQQEAIHCLNDPYQAVVWDRAKTMLQSEIDWLCQFLERCASESFLLMKQKEK